MNDSLSFHFFYISFWTYKLTHHSVTGSNKDEDLLFFLTNQAEIFDFYFQGKYLPSIARFLIQNNT